MISYTLQSLGAPVARGEESFAGKILDHRLNTAEFLALNGQVKCIGVSARFKDVCETFPSDDAATPPGFRRELTLGADGLLEVDLVRDIAYDKNGIRRPTQVLFSADTANPYEVEPISRLIANLTCNPGIIYNQFINNPEANVGNKFKTRDEVMTELARILGPGADVSVELNNPFDPDFEKLLDEANRFKEIFSEYCVVIKVPHTGPVTAENVRQLLQGDGQLEVRYTDVTTRGAFLGHNLAHKLHEAGFRVNFTLMFDPFQTQLALQARPYFINAFVRHRLNQSHDIAAFVEAYEETGDEQALRDLRKYLVQSDCYTPSQGDDLDLQEVYAYGRSLLTYRHYYDDEGSDGLDSMRHNLRVLKNCNMADTRLIACSIDGELNYPDIDKLLCEPEFLGMNDRVVITAPPKYLARFTSSIQVITYQRMFLRAAEGQS